jgi:hypothetical protein
MAPKKRKNSTLNKNVSKSSRRIHDDEEDDDDDDNLFSLDELQALKSQSSQNETLTGVEIIPGTIYETPTSSITSLSALSDSNSTEQTEVTSKYVFIHNHQDWRDIKVLKRCSYKKQILQFSVTVDEMMVNIVGINKVLELPGLSRYHVNLEYPKCFVRATNNALYCIEPIIFCIVHFMLHILTREGLGAKNVWETAMHIFTEPGKFSVDPIMNINFLRVITSDIDLLKKIKKIPENWKTLMKTRSETFRNKFLQSIESSRPLPKVIFRLVWLMIMFLFFLIL